MAVHVIDDRIRLITPFQSLKQILNLLVGRNQVFGGRFTPGLFACDCPVGEFVSCSIPLEQVDSSRYVRVELRLVWCYQKTRNIFVLQKTIGHQY